MQIPSKFSILGREFTITEDPNLQAERKLGLIDFDNAIIRLQKIEDSPKMRQAFFHEMVHAILFSMAKNDMAQNEEFVDLFSGMLDQALTTME